MLKTLDAETCPKNNRCDSLFYEKNHRLPRSGPAEEPQTNYKKRYDDLKHKDQRISEFKQEQELEAVARASQPEYAPPKAKKILSGLGQNILICMKT